MTCKVELVPLIALMVTEDVELLVSESWSVFELPTATVPKFRLLLPTETPPPPEFPDRI